MTRKKRRKVAVSAETPAQETPETSIPETPEVAKDPETPFDPPKTVPDAPPDHSLVPMPGKKGGTPDQLLRYWLSIPKREAAEWFIAYVYRDLPVCDPLQTLSPADLRAIRNGERKKPAINIGKLTEPLDPVNWLQQFRARWGAGDYHIFLNDQHPSKKATVKETYFDAGRDWDNYPPLLEVDQVVLADPKNEGYLRWARLKGIKFPGDPEFKNSAERESEDDMAATATVEKLTDALIRQTEQNQQHRGPVVTTSEGGSADTVKVMADAALKGQSILLDSIKAAQNATAKAQDPLEFHKSVMEAAKLATPAPATVAAPVAAPDNTALIMKMMQMQQESNDKLIAQMEKRLEFAEKLASEARTAHVAPAAPVVNPTVANPVKDAIDLIKGLVSLRDTAGSLLGGEAAEASMPAWERIATKVLDNAPGMLYNIAAMKNGAARPVPPPDLNPELIEKEQQIESAQPEQPQTQEEPVVTERLIAQTLAAPLLDSINKGEKGYQFAAGMMLNPKILGVSGRVAYEMAIEQGEQGMMKICQSYPPLWEKLIQIPKSFQQFLTEFLNRDIAQQIVNQHLAQQQGKPIVPEVIPPQTAKPNGRMVVDPKTGQPVQTSHKGPQVNDAAS